MLDLYERRWEGELLHPGEYVDLRRREDPDPGAAARRTDAPRRGPGRPQRVEHEYERGGALAYLAAWDVHRGQLFGRCEPKTGIAPFGRLVEQVMTTEPYASRQTRVLDRRQRLRPPRPELDRPPASPVAEPRPRPPADPRLLAQPDRDLLLDHPAQGADPQRLRQPPGVAARLNAFEHHYSQIAKPFEWTFTRADLAALIARLAAHEPQLRLAA